MKPCPEHGSSIALLAIESLDTSAKAALQEHLTTCSRCRAHFQDLQQIHRTLQQAAEATETHELPDRFHQRLEARLRQDATTRASVSWLDRFAEWFSVPRMTLAGGVAVLVVLAVVFWRSPVEQKNPPTATLGSTNRETLAVNAINRGAAGATLPPPAPTLMAMRQAWSGSPERLDALLAHQERLLAANDPATRALGGPVIGF